MRIKDIPAKEVEITDKIEEEGFKAKIKASVRRETATVKIKGFVEVECVVVCKRCLDEFVYRAGEDFTINLKPSSYLISEVHLTREDLDDEFYQGDTVSLHELFRSMARSLVPDYPLCLEDCKGICPKCGENLNRADCKCKQ